jgi:hypothetical protein
VRHELSIINHQGAIMLLSLDTWYRISFPNIPGTATLFVSVEDDMGAPLDHLVVEIDADADVNVDKIHMISQSGTMFALCTDGQYCLNGSTGVLYINEYPEDPTITVISLPIPNSWEWFSVPNPGFLQLDLFCSYILAGHLVNPCDPNQPETADPNSNPALRSVGAFPMQFGFAGGLNPDGGNPGKKVRVIWKTEM